MITFQNELTVFIINLCMLLCDCLILYSNMTFLRSTYFYFVSLFQRNLIIWVIFWANHLHLQYSIFLILYINILLYSCCHQSVGCNWGNPHKVDQICRIYGIVYVVSIPQYNLLILCQQQLGTGLY